MEITNVTKQTQYLANALREALGHAGFDYEHMTFESALVVERACGLVASEARGHAWNNGQTAYDEARRTSDTRLPIAAMMDKLLPLPYDEDPSGRGE